MTAISERYNKLRHEIPTGNIPLIHVAPIFIANWDIPYRALDGLISNTGRWFVSTRFNLVSQHHLVSKITITAYQLHERISTYSTKSYRNIDYMSTTENRSGPMFSVLKLRAKFSDVPVHRYGFISTEDYTTAAMPRDYRRRYGSTYRRFNKESARTLNKSLAWPIIHCIVDGILKLVYRLVWLEHYTPTEKFEL